MWQKMPRENEITPLQLWGYKNVFSSFLRYDSSPHHLMLVGHDFDNWQFQWGYLDRPNLIIGCVSLQSISYSYLLGISDCHYSRIRGHSGRNCFWESFGSFLDDLWSWILFFHCRKSNIYNSESRCKASWN